MPQDQKPPKKLRFDEEAFSQAKAAADKIFEEVPEARSVAVLIDFGIDSPDVPCASWHTPSKEVSHEQVLGMLKRVPSLYNQLVGVMMRFTKAFEENVDVNSGTSSRSDCNGK